MGKEPLIESMKDELTLLDDTKSENIPKKEVMKLQQICHWN